MKRKDYRTRVKAMTDEQLTRYIDKSLDHVISLAGGDELNRLIYAKSIAKKRGILKGDQE